MLVISPRTILALSLSAAVAVTCSCGKKAENVDTFCSDGAQIDVPRDSAAAVTCVEIRGACTVQCAFQGPNGCEDYGVYAMEATTCYFVVHFVSTTDYVLRLDFAPAPALMCGALVAPGGKVDAGLSNDVVDASIVWDANEDDANRDDGGDAGD